MTCLYCTKEKPGYSAKCLDCCARLIKSARCENPAGRKVSVGQQKMLFDAIAIFPDACKREDIIERIKQDN